MRIGRIHRIEDIGMNFLAEQYHPVYPAYPHYPVKSTGVKRIL